jgi:hypothetical protein
MMKALVRLMSRQKTLAFLETFQRDLPVEEKFLAFYGLQMLRRNEILAYAPSLEPEQARRVGLFKIVSDPQDLVRQAARRAPKRPTVAIFPRGGVTFPVVGDNVAAPQVV